MTLIGARTWLLTGFLAGALAFTSPTGALAGPREPTPGPTPTPTQSASATTTEAPTPTATPHAPVPATRTTKARHVPAYPANSKERGRRIVYDKGLMTVWLIDGREQVVARFPVVGRADRPATQVYRVYSKSQRSANPTQKLTFANMVRFAHGQSTGAPIGFHDIPRTYDGRPIHGEDALGLPLGVGGCVRMSTEASEQVYAFARIGTTVEVVSTK